MKKIAIIAALAVLATGFASAAKAQEVGSNLLSFSGGYYDILDDDGAADFRLEYRQGEPILFNMLKPWLGFEITSDLSAWGGAGLLLDIPLGQSWYLAPNVGVGLYTDGDSDLDLGHPIEFRSQLELGYKFENETRLGMSFGHLSNASLDDDNPGTEVLSVYWHTPVANIFH